MTARIGIDLGTTNCCVAYVDPNTNIPRLLEVEPGQPFLSSVLAQTAQEETLVGWNAKIAKHPVYRYAFVKRAIGMDLQFPLAHGVQTATWISAQFLHALKACAERTLGTDVAAVVTVPAYFTAGQAQATRQAAEEAGLTLLTLVPEPIAAALAY